MNGGMRSENGPGAPELVIGNERRGGELAFKACAAKGRITCKDGTCFGQSCWRFCKFYEKKAV